jgi:Asp-tRNA(Asn)/Glu-tRNA(Gln) amidotransferase A subunit family amidase
MTTILDHTELGSLDAVATAERIRAGEFSAREAVVAAIDRANALEPILNAISTETFESALSKSEAPPRGPFSGVPTFIKGLEDEKGVVNDHGSRAAPTNGLGLNLHSGCINGITTVKDVRRKSPPTPKTGS